jgi:hypothetical protein
MRATRNRTGEQWISLQAAATALGASRQGTLALIVKGDLIGEHIAGRTLVDKRSVEAYKRQQTKAA